MARKKKQNFLTKNRKQRKNTKNEINMQPRFFFLGAAMLILSLLALFGYIGIDTSIYQKDMAWGLTLMGKMGTVSGLLISPLLILMGMPKSVRKALLKNAR